MFFPFYKRPVPIVGGYASFKIMAKLSSIFVGAFLSTFLILGLKTGNNLHENWGIFECALFSDFNFLSDLSFGRRQAFKFSGSYFSN